MKIKPRISIVNVISCCLIVMMIILFLFEEHNKNQCLQNALCAYLYTPSCLCTMQKETFDLSDSILLVAHKITLKKTKRQENENQNKMH